MATTGAAIPETSDTLLSGSVSNILNLQATATTDTAAATADTANATAATTSATGYTAEGASYQTSADIAAQNAVTAQLAGQVTTLQEARTMRTTEGEQQAAVAGSGFGASGSSLDIIRSSLQQGYLTQQLNTLTATETAGGYLEEQSAALAEKAATKVSADAATALASSDTTAASTATTAGNLATANAASETSALKAFIGTSPLSTGQQLIVSPLTTSGTLANTASVSSTGTVTNSTGTVSTLGSVSSTGTLTGTNAALASTFNGYGWSNPTTGATTSAPASAGISIADT